MSSPSTSIWVKFSAPLAVLVIIVIAIFAWGQNEGEKKGIEKGVAKGIPIGREQVTEEERQAAREQKQGYDMGLGLGQREGYRVGLERVQAKIIELLEAEKVKQDSGKTIPSRGEKGSQGSPAPSKSE